MLQSALRSPLVDHYILGIGSGALFSTYIAILLVGYSLPHVTIASVVGGLIALSLTTLLAEKMSGSDIAYVLAGLGVTALFTGLASFTQFFVISRYQYAVFLMLGSFSIATLDKAIYALMPVGLVLAGYALLAKELNVLLYGDDYSRQLGLDPRRVRAATSILAGVASSITVAYFGLVGFIGLVSPHIARLLLKTPDNRVVIPVSSTIGSILAYSADSLSRGIAVYTMSEVPAGSILFLVGAPFFLVILLARLAGGSK
jgi:iron complex transport system permease protein